MVLLERLQRQLTIGRGANVEAFQLEEPLQHLAGIDIVFDDHDGRHGVGQAERRPRASVMNVVKVWVISCGAQGF